MPPLAEQPTTPVLERDEEKNRGDTEPRPANREDGGRRECADEWQGYKTEILVALFDAS